MARDLANSLFLYVLLLNNSSIIFLFQQIFVIFIYLFIYLFICFKDKGFDKNCAQESRLCSSEQNQQFISGDLS